MLDGKELVINVKWIRRAAFIYISAPLFCFFIGWLRWYFAVLTCATLILCLFLSDDYFSIMFFCKKQGKDEGKEVKTGVESLKMPFGMPLVIVGISFAYSFFCGIGRFWAQSKDYPWRNAIFRDLMYRDWPVKYDKYDGALVYYIGQWLPPAVIGKIAYKLGIGENATFLIGNIALIIYVTIGLSILFLLLFVYFNPQNIKAMLLIVAGFIFFSGMDIVASIEPLGANNYHLEWWAFDYQYSSFTTCMCWVFNQAIIPWICMALMLKEKNVSNFVFLGMICLFSGPLPFVGFFIYCVSIGIKRLTEAIGNKKVLSFVKKMFSVSNILAAIFIFPFIGAYLLSNAALTGAESIGLSKAVTEVQITSSASVDETSVDESLEYEAYSDEMAVSETSENTNTLADAVGTYIKFIFLEFGIFALLILWRNYKKYLYYVTIGQLLIYPFVRLGYSTDFTMRASIPALFMMYVMCYEFVLKKSETFPDKEKTSGTDNVNSNKGWDIITLKRYAFVILVICLILGAATPTVEFIRGFRQVAKRGIDDPVTDFLYTLGGDGPYSNNKAYKPEPNFVALDLDNQFFFKYFAKD